MVLPFQNFIETVQSSIPMYILIVNLAINRKACDFSLGTHGFLFSFKCREGIHHPYSLYHKKWTPQNQFQMDLI